MATKAEATSTESRPSRPNSLDTGGAVLRALARSSHFREGFRQPVEPETDMQPVSYTHLTLPTKRIV